MEKSNIEIDPIQLEQFINEEWENNAKKSFIEYLKVPNVSPAYDKDWKTNGLLKKAAVEMINYAYNCGISGLNANLSSDDDMTPFIMIQVDSTAKDGKSIVLYGHYDKQPPLEGWETGKGPYTPVEENDYIFARGSADDGYALYATLVTIKSLQRMKIPHPKLTLLIEGSEESGSIDLPFYIEKYKQYIGVPDLIVAMDSISPDYNRFWFTNSIRGVLDVDVTVQTLKKGIHSGIGSGVVPETFMIARNLISRLEDYKKEMLPMKQLEIDIPEEVVKSAQRTVDILGDNLTKFVPILPGGQFLSDDKLKLYLHSSWFPTLSVLGIKGAPEVKTAGNVLRPFTKLRLGVRIPPTFDSEKAKEIIEKTLTENPPFNCSIKVETSHSDGAYVATTTDKLKTELNRISQLFFKNDFAEVSIGGTIPFIKIFSNMFPKSLMVVTGASGADSKPHSINEKLNIPYTKKFMCSLGFLIGEYSKYVE